MKRNVMLVLTALLVLSVVLSACGPTVTPTPQIVTKEVVVTKEVPGKEVVVTKEVQVILTPTPVPAAAGPATFERSETLYVAGAAWGPAST